MDYRLIPFTFSTEDQYMLEFSALKIRVIKNGALVESGGSPISITTPYAAADLGGIHYAQSADILFMAHKDHYPRRLSRTSDTTWTLEVLPLEDGPYKTREAGDDSIIVEPTSTTGSITITASSALFTADMEDQPFRIGYADSEDPTDIDWGWGTITAVNSSTEAEMTVEDNLGYQMIYNGEFDSSLDGWENYDSGPNDGVEWDLTTQSMKFTKGDPDPHEYACELQQVSFFIPRATVRLSCTVTVAAAITTHIRVYVGTTARGTNLLSPQTITVTGPDTVDFAHVLRSPTSSESMFVSFDNYDCTIGDVAFVDDVSLIRAELATSEWRAPAWGDPDTGRGYGFPSNVIFHEQRLVFSNSYGFPQTVWMSMTGNFYNFGFTSPGADDDTISYMLASRKINAIQWMVSATDLLLGTYSGIWKMGPGGQTDAITPTSVVARLQTSDGCAALEPLTIGSMLLYVQRGNRSVRSLKYALESDSYQGDDLTVLSRHLFETRKIISWDYAGLPDQVVWCVMDDGTMLGLTFMPEHEVLAWHQHSTGRLGTDAFLYVSVLQGVETDEVYFLAQRGDNTCVEMFEKRISLAEDDTVEVVETTGIERIVWEGNDYPYRYWFVDSAVEHVGSATDTLSGLDHIDDAVVSILADGEVVAQQTVFGGEILLERASNRIIAGLPITSRIDTLDVELPDNQGSALKRAKVINKLTLRLHRSRYALVAPRGENYLNESDTTENYEEIKFRDQSDEENPTALRTGNFDVQIRRGWNKTGGISIKNDQPLPLTILAIIPEVYIGDR